MPLRFLSLLLVVNFSTLLAGAALADEPASTPLRGPKSTDTSLLQRQIGPLNPTDTLWRIAERVKPDGANVSTYQVMYAIYLKNPDAFIDGNLNHLRPGATIQLPNLREIRAVDGSVARAKSDSDDLAWAERAKAASRAGSQQSSNPQPVATAASDVQLQQLTELKDQFGNSLLMIEAIARENNQLKTTLSQVQTELLALQQQLGEDSALQQQLNTLLQQQADILAAQQAQELQAAEAAKAVAAEQAQGPGILNNPLVWVLAASIPALLILFGVVLWLKRRGQQTEAAVVAANSAAVPPAHYKSPLPPLDESNDLDDSGLFDIDESLLDDAFADHGDFTGTEVMDDSLPDFNDATLLDDDNLLDDDILLDDDSLLASQAADISSAEDDLLDDLLGETDLADKPAKTEFDANNILSDSDLNALLSAEDDDDAIIELDDDELDLVPVTADEPDQQFTAEMPDDDILEAVTPSQADDVDDEVVTLDDETRSPDVQTRQPAQDTVDELIDEDELLEEIELDIEEEPGAAALLPTAEPVTELATEQATESKETAGQALDDDEQILVETDNVSEPVIDERGHDELTDTQIASLVEDESFDRTELDAFAEALALEGSEYSVTAEATDDEQASELLSAELDELLQQVDAVDAEAAGEDNSADELDDVAEPVVDSEGPDLQSNEDDSVTKPSEAALSVENPSKMLESYPELKLTDDDLNDEHLVPEYVPDDETVSIELAPADQDADQNLAKLDESQFDNLLTELEAMAQTTAIDSEDLSLDVDSVFSPTLDDDELVALSDADFVEIDNLLASSEQMQEDDGRFEQLNVDVGLDEFADVIGNDNPQDVDTEDNGFAAKLDLVRAYIEIDDQDSAEQIIAEILDSDAPEHVKTEAKTLQKPIN